MRDCCANLENRSEPVQVKEDLEVTHCTECGAKHYELSVDPAIFELFGAKVG